MEFPPQIPWKIPAVHECRCLSQGSFAVPPQGALSVVGLPPAPLGAPVRNAGASHGERCCPT